MLRHRKYYYSRPSDHCPLLDTSLQTRFPTFRHQFADPDLQHVFSRPRLRSSQENVVRQALTGNLFGFRYQRSYIHKLVLSLSRIYLTQPRESLKINIIICTSPRSTQTLPSLSTCRLTVEEPRDAVTLSLVMVARPARGDTFDVMKPFHSGQYNNKFHTYSRDRMVIDNSSSRNCSKHQVRCDYMDTQGGAESSSSSTSIPSSDIFWSADVEIVLDRWQKAGYCSLGDNMYSLQSSGYIFSKSDLHLVYQALWSSGSNSLRPSDYTVWTSKMPK